MKHQCVYILFIILSSLYSQNRELLKIHHESISIADFIQTYDKNRLDNDTLSFEKSLEEYLNLYVNFKLKVTEAKSLGLDTVPAFIRELESYRKQLVKPYLTDTQVSDQLLYEAYERLQTEVSVSHILIQSDDQDTSKAYSQILDIRKKIMSGADFKDLARKFSNDPSVQDNDGDLGYFTALYMVYPFETAAYNTVVGGISQPIKTRFGYHILKVNDKRPSRGEVKVAHIMVKSSNKNDSLSLVSSKIRIDEIYDSLLFESGTNFSQLAKKYSDDKKSGSNGGALDWFGVNKMVKSFEDISFSLDSIGSFSKPFKTDFGWHIVQLLDKKKLPPLKDLESSLKKKIERDSRSQKTRDVVISRLKNEWGFSENIAAQNMFYQLINKDFFEGADISSQIKGNGLVMFLFNKHYNNADRYVYQRDFADYLMTYRARFPKKTDYRSTIDQFYKTFQEQKILELESNNLEHKYDDFRLLIDEYHDGILLFNLSEDVIWNKAIQDTIGLQSFYQNNRQNYVLERQVKASIYSSKDERVNKKVYNRINWGFSDQDILSNVNKTSSLNLSINSGLFEYGENNVLDDFVFSLDWKSLEKGDVINCDSINKVIVIEELFENSIRSLDDIKGLVISDYQSFLETEWLKDLKSKYNVSVNQELFSLVKQQKIDYDSVDRDFLLAPNCDSFSACFHQAGKILGYSKDVFFGWNGRVYTTEK